MNGTTRIVLIFVDGFGWGAPDRQTNPCLDYGGSLLRVPDAETSATIPAAQDGDPRRLPGSGAWARPIDAILGVDGVPQSATGQTSLLTGVNAQAVLGKHLTGFPNETLRSILLEHSVLRTLRRRGRRVAFINAFRPRFFDFPRERQLLFSATTVANLAADLPFFRLEDIAAGRSIYQEFTNRSLQERGFDVPTFTPAEAGAILAKQAREYDFLLYEYFQTDRAGHAQDRRRVAGEMLKLDEFVGRLLADLGLRGADANERRHGGDDDAPRSHSSEDEHRRGPEAAPDDPQYLVLLTSDHGNLEDVSTKRHTRNPVPLFAWGDGAQEFVAATTGLTDVTRNILQKF